MTLEQTIAAVVEAFRNSALTSVDLTITKQPINNKPGHFEIQITTNWTAQAGGGTDGIPATTLKTQARGKSVQECMAQIKGQATAQAQVSVAIGQTLG